MPKYEMTYRKSDIRAFFDDNAKNSLKRNMLFLYSGCGIIVLLMLMCISLVSKLDFTVTSPWTYVLIAVIAFIVLFATGRTVRRSFEKMYDDFMSVYDKDTIITCSFGIDRVFITSTGSSGNGSIMYSDLEKVVESDNYFYLFVDAQFAQIVRKSAITEGEVEKTAEILKNAVKDKYNDNTKLRRNEK